MNRVLAVLVDLLEDGCGSTSTFDTGFDGLGHLSDDDQINSTTTTIRTYVWQCGPRWYR